VAVLSQYLDISLACDHVPALDAICSLIDGHHNHVGDLYGIIAVALRKQRERLRRHVKPASAQLTSLLARCANSKRSLRERFFWCLFSFLEPNPEASALRIARAQFVCFAATFLDNSSSSTSAARPLFSAVSAQLADSNVDLEDSQLDHGTVSA
jgi:hypothetical protein